MKIFGFWVNGKTFVKVDRSTFPEDMTFPRAFRTTSGFIRTMEEIDGEGLVEDLDIAGRPLGTFRHAGEP